MPSLWKSQMNASDGSGMFVLGTVVHQFTMVPGNDHSGCLMDFSGFVRGF
jgi:hypothetical protein